MYRKRYRAAARQERWRLLDEFCNLSGYHQKYATTLSNRPQRAEDQPRRRLRGSARAFWCTADATQARRAVPKEALCRRRLPA